MAMLTNQSTSADNRANKRFDIRLVAFIILGQSEIPATLVNISKGGAKLEVPSYLDFENKQILVRFEGCTETIPAEIKWSGFAAIGVEFQIEGSMRVCLEKFISGIEA